ncbi:MAG: NUDIX domain-containing protein [Patescibacteria group bacterium]|nr:NUDIX domain-containing protein [Patescibacteria group bacterium]
MSNSHEIRCLIHGSFRKYWSQIVEARRLFMGAGITVLAPSADVVVGSQDDFILFAGEAGRDARQIELEYLLHLRRLGADGFSYFVVPDGYLGRTAAYELGVALARGVRCVFSEEPKDLPIWYPRGNVTAPAVLAAHVIRHGRLPRETTAAGERPMADLASEVTQRGTLVAAGGIIEHIDTRGRRDILLVRTHKWGDRWSVVGGKVRPGETVRAAYRREALEETGLRVRVGRHLATFDQLRGSGYWLRSTHHLFVDFVARADSRRVTLNDEAEEHVWLPAGIALRDLNLEPNAKKIVRLYAQTCLRAA